MRLLPEHESEGESEHKAAAQVEELPKVSTRLLPERWCESGKESESEQEAAA